MGTVRADNFSDGAGTGAPDFATGVKVSGGFDSTGGAGLATDTQAGLVYKPDADSVALTDGNKNRAISNLDDIAGTNLSVTLAVAGRIAFSFSCTSESTGTAQYNFGIKLDGTVDLNGTSGLGFGDTAASEQVGVSITGLTDVLSAGVHTFVAQFSCNGGQTVTAYAGPANVLRFAAWTI